MIIIKLAGGLGNQLFQYAVGRKLSLQNKTILKFDTSEYKTINDRRYSLQYFNIVENIASRGEINEFKKYSRFPWKLVDKSRPLVKKKFINQTSEGKLYFHFNPLITELKDNKYLEGYWQSEKYFKDIENIIRSEVVLKTTYRITDSDLINEIIKTNSISIHIRRGDYVNDPKTKTIHGNLPLNYYRQAISLIASKITSPSFIIFSDDPDWTKNNFNFIRPVVFISDYGYKDYQELILLSLCHYHIIANSSFSWWGAWLSAYPDKIVITPKAWLNDKQYNTQDIIPENWLKI